MNQPQRIVLDTNCLLISIPYRSPYHTILTAFLSGAYTLCITNEILLEYDKYRINAKSIMGIIAFNPSEGMNVTIAADGNDENEAVEALEKFLVCE